VTTPDTAVETTLAQRTAADLRFLADLAAGNATIAEQLAPAVEQLRIVLRHGSPVDPGQIIESAVEAGATEIKVPERDGWFPEYAACCPAGAIALHITALAPPPERQPLSGTELFAAS
jgi:hypothetical protein